MFPSDFNKNDYIQWHHQQWPADNSLEHRLDEFRTNLKETSKNDLLLLSELLYYIIPTHKKEYLIANKTEFDYKIPLSDIVTAQEENTVQYDFLFKSTDSIINKLWRKNKANLEVNLENIKSSITDLVRTEVVCSTLAACGYIATRLNSENINLPPDYDLKKRIDDNIENIKFEPEMKMSSGYFAYHGLIHFKSGLVVELQIYSSLTANWRKLSHKLYDKVRVNAPQQYDFGTSEARLISLGHLLHLAECEVQRLEKEIAHI